MLAPANTVVDGIPLWRRIRELMKEKGSRYSMTAVANRIGISRETLRLMLNGEREIYMFELEKIAADLKLPVARILQHDIQDLHGQVRESMVSLKEMEAAMELSKRRYERALGLSEKAHALLDIRYLHTFQQQWTEAEQVSLAAQELILQIGLTEEEDELLFKLKNHLVTIYTHTRRYAKGLETLHSMEPLIEKSKTRMISYYHNKGICLYGLFRVQEAKACLYKAAELQQALGMKESLGRVCFFVGYIECRELNYSRAKEMFQESLRYLQTDIMRVGSAKDLAKVMLKLGERQAAERLIRETLQSETVKQNMEMEARLLILLAKTLDLPYHAEAVAGNAKYPQNMRFLAARFLRLYYRRWFMQGRFKRVKAVGKMPLRRFSYDRLL